MWHPERSEGSYPSYRELDQRQYHVYIMSSHRRVLYVGVTNDLARRVSQHKSGALEGFTKRYKVTQLVYAEACNYIEDALRREKEIKGWRREKKLELVLGLNPQWNDLSVEWNLTGS